MSSPRRSSGIELRGLARPGPRSSPAPAGAGRDVRVPRRSAARALAQIAFAPFAAFAAAVAGLVFLALLPVCGIASLAEGFARACWGVVLRALRGRGALSHD